MIARSAAEDINYYKGRVLSLIINNPGRYGLREINDLLGFNKELLQEIISEYGRAGFQISYKKGRLFSKTLPENMRLINEIMKKQEYERYIVYKRIRSCCNNENGIRLEDFTHDFKNSSHKLLTNEGYLKRVISHIEKAGLIYIKKGFIKVVNNPFEAMEDKKLLKLLIFINIMKNIYPRRSLLNNVYLKLLGEYEGRGFRFDSRMVQYFSKNKISIYDEISLKLIENAINEDKSIEFTYKTQVGVKNIKINPSGIIYNRQKDMWYVVTFGERQTEYRLDKISNLNITEGGAGHFAKGLYEYSMGISSEDITEVKAVFKKEDYVYKRLQSYIKNRKSAVLRETNKAFILTDRVCGINEFKKWLRSFREDAVCLKPEKLRDEILREAKLLKERYGVI